MRRTRRRASTLSVESFSEAARGRRGQRRGDEAGEGRRRRPRGGKRRTSERERSSRRANALKTNELVDVVADEAWIDPSNARCRRGRSVDRPFVGSDRRVPTKRSRQIRVTRDPKRAFSEKRTVRIMVNAMRRTTRVTSSLCGARAAVAERAPPTDARDGWRRLREPESGWCLEGVG